LELEALNGIRRFIRFAKRIGRKEFEKEEIQEGKYGQGRLPENIIAAVEKIAPELAEMAKYLNALYLNHPDYGIHDPELGLTVVPSDEEDKHLHKIRRENLAFNLARDLSQAGLKSEPPRRQRYNTASGAVSIEGMKKDDESVGIEPTTTEKGAGWQHYTRRQILNPKPDVLGRPIWNVPLFNDAIDNTFQTARNVIATRFGPEAAKISEIARKKMQIEMSAIDELYEAAEKELAAQGLPEGEQRHNAASKLVSQRLPARLKELDPELFKTYKETDWASIRLASKQGKTTYIPPNQEVHSSKIRKFLDELLENDTAVLPEYRDDIKDYIYESEVSLANIPVSAADVVTFLRYISDDENIVKDYAWRLLVNAASYQDVDLSDEEAIEALKAVGITPKEVGKEPVKPVEKPKVEPAKEPIPTKPEPQKVAARSIPELLEDLPSNHIEIYNRRNELSPYKNQFKTAFDHLQKVVTTKVTSKTEINPDEMAALTHLRELL
jgi:hypothetical protein